MVAGGRRLSQVGERSLISAAFRGSNQILVDWDEEPVSGIAPRSLAIFSAKGQLRFAR